MLQKLQKIVAAAKNIFEKGEISMKYPESEEIFGGSTYSLDGDEGDKKDDAHKAALIVSKFTGISVSKLEYFIKNFGLNAVLNNPSLMYLTNEQKKLIKELKYLILSEVGANETNGNNQPV